jgi:superfamily II DNA or RNA helicase
VSDLLPMRDYQREAVEANESAWERGLRRPANVLPTGAGKTVVFAHQAKRYRDRHPGKRVLVLAHRKELVEQAAERLHDVMPRERIGIVKATRNETLAPYVVASVQTLAQSGRRAQLFDVGLIVVDECHHAAARTYVDVLTHFGALETASKTGGAYRGYADDPALALGVTATMIRGDEKALGEIWQDVVYSRSISDMIAKGWLVRPRGKRIRVADLDLRGVRKLAGDYSGSQLGAALEDSLAPVAVAKAIAEHAPDRPTLLFAPLVSTAELFRDALREAGFTAEVVSDRTPEGERGQIVKAFRRREIQIICNAMLFTEGTDLPLVSCIVVARPTLNPGLYVQMVGRGLRLDQGKDDCLVLDVVGASQKHRLISPTELFGTDSVFDFEDEADEQAIELGEEEEGDGGAAEEPLWRDGPLVAEDVDLFHGSDSVWLYTAAGVAFLAPGDRYIAIVPAVGGAPGYDVVSMHQTRLGESRYIAEGVQSVSYAMGWAEDDVTPRERAQTSRERSWRAARPSTVDLRRARSMGITHERGMSAGELRNRVMVAAATWRIDSRLAARMAMTR